MISVDTLIDQTLGLRQTIVKLLKSIPIEHADTIPPTWHNNARWHAGHLLITPCMITYGIMKEPLPLPAEYRQWFAKGSSPAGWENPEAMPGFIDLVDDIVPSAGRLFDDLKPRLEEPFIEPYATSAGPVLRTPAEALNFSLAHDGIHLGMLMALVRALQVSH
jgi:hypothetical protein